ncbi:hypothetical protein [Nocardia concava]|uniref:hypothetical protein n=1 Tax=Nocardia concava TaxID=257281 RepID=UPI0002F0F7E8|nr:hypothetical protein [Nocardia concava]
MTGLRSRRRSLAIAGALCLAAAALVAVSVPASAESERGLDAVPGNYLRHDSTVMMICGGAVQDSTPLLLVA